MSNWISVKNKLPDITIHDNGDNDHLHEYKSSCRVLLFLTSGHQHIGSFVSVLREKHSSRHEQWVEVDDCGSLSLDMVTHWMDLPPAPKECKK